MASPPLPFLETLNFSDLSKITNGMIQYNLAWPQFPTKIL